MRLVADAMLGRLAANAKALSVRQLEAGYGALFMTTLKVKATAKKG